MSPIYPHVEPGAPPAQEKMFAEDIFGSVIMTVMVPIAREEWEGGELFEGDLFITSTNLQTNPRKIESVTINFSAGEYMEMIPAPGQCCMSRTERTTDYLSHERNYHPAPSSSCWHTTALGYTSQVIQVHEDIEHVYRGKIQIRLPNRGSSFEVDRDLTMVGGKIKLRTRYIAQIYIPNEKKGLVFDIPVMNHAFHESAGRTSGIPQIHFSKRDSFRLGNLSGNLTFNIRPLSGHSSEEPAATKSSVLSTAQQTSAALPHCVAGLEMLLSVDYELEKGFQELSHVTATLVHEAKIHHVGASCFCLPSSCCFPSCRSSMPFSNFPKFGQTVTTKKGTISTTIVPRDPTALGDFAESRYFFTLSTGQCCGCWPRAPLVRELIVLPPEVLRSHLSKIELVEKPAPSEIPKVASSQSLSASTPTRMNVNFSHQGGSPSKVPSYAQAKNSAIPSRQQQQVAGGGKLDYSVYDQLKSDEFVYESNNNNNSKLRGGYNAVSRPPPAPLELSVQTKPAQEEALNLPKPPAKLEIADKFSHIYHSGEDDSYRPRNV